VLSASSPARNYWKRRAPDTPHAIKVRAAARADCNSRERCLARSQHPAHLSADTRYTVLNFLIERRGSSINNATAITRSVKCLWSSSEPSSATSFAHHSLIHPASSSSLGVFLSPDVSLLIRLTGWRGAKARGNNARIWFIRPRCSSSFRHRGGASRTALTIVLFLVSLKFSHAPETLPLPRLLLLHFSAHPLRLRSPV